MQIQVRRGEVETHRDTSLGIDDWYFSRLEKMCLTGCRVVIREVQFIVVLAYSVAPCGQNKLPHRFAAEYRVARMRV